MKRSFFSILAAIVVLSWIRATPAQAQDAPGLVLEVAAGFDGLSRAGQPTPITVRASNTGPALDGELRVIVANPGSGDETVYSAPLSLPTQSDKRVPLIISSPTFGSTPTIQFVTEAGVAAETDAGTVSQVPPDTLLIGVVSPEPGALAYLEAAAGPPTDAAVAFLALDDLPQIAPAWTALDVLILDDSDTSRLTPDQLAALRAWTETGGLLVVTGGAGGPQTAAGVADLLPVAVSGTATADALPALSALAGSSDVPPGQALLTQADLRPGAELLLGEVEAPLVVAGPLGQGQVVFLALDPKGAPMTNRPLAEAVWGLVIDRLPAATPWAGGIRDAFAASSAVASVPGLQLPSVWQLGLFGLVYAIIIGPVNYLILKRLNRREWAWVTIPALVVLFSALTLLTSFRTRGSAALINQMTVAQGPLGGSGLRAETVLGLYSPRRGRFDLTLPAATVAQPFAEGFGAIEASNNLDAIELSTMVTLRGIQAGSNSIATFLIDHAQPAPAISATARLSPEGDELVVDVRNDDVFPLENVTLVVGQDQRGLGTLAPGQAQTVTLPVTARPALAGGPTPTPDPFFPAGAPVANPLLADPTLVLGTPDYFNDAEAYARFQLLQSLYNPDSPSALPADPTAAITLAGWRTGPVLEATLAGSGMAEQAGATLYLLDVPVE